jgi:hypothetical protein
MNAGTIGTLGTVTAALLLWSCTETGTVSTTESGVVSGRLLTTQDKPVAGAVVTLVSADHVPSPLFGKTAAEPRAVTDADGRYRIENVDAGVYNLSATKDSLASFRDSMKIPAAGLEAGADTLRRTGSLEGRVTLSAGGDARTVLILALGTNTLVVPKDSSGDFRLGPMAEGEYHVRFLSAISEYLPLDTVFRIRSGAVDTLAGPVRIRFNGIEAVTGLGAAWNPDRQAVELSWLGLDTTKTAGYNLYRAPKGTPFGSVPLNAAPIAAPAYVDTAVEAGQEYVYAVKALDRNGNPGKILSSAASVNTAPAYVLAGTIKPQGYTQDNAPLAVSAGEIYWLEPDRVDVYDTSGTLERTFGNQGADSLIQTLAIRVIGDIVYVVDRSRSSFDFTKDDKNLRILLKSFSKQGDFLGSRDVTGFFDQDRLSAAYDFQISGDGTLFTTTGYAIHTLSPSGIADSIASPLGLDVQNLFSKVEFVGDKLLVMGSFRILPSGRKTTRLTLLDRDLTVSRLDSADYFLNAYAGDAQGNIWVIRDDSLAVAMTPALEVTRKVKLPKSLYRDILVDEGVLYIFDYETTSILIYRKPGD